MHTYIYKARDLAGKAVRGNMQASSKEELYEKLHNLGYLATEASAALPSIKIDSIVDRFRTIRGEEMVMFNVQLANLIHAGISLLDSLAAQVRQIENKKLREVTESVSRSVESGESFSDALASHPKVFPNLFVCMVKAGEMSGNLDMILTQYAAYCEEQEEL